MLLNYQVRIDSRLIAEGSIETPFELGRQNDKELDLKPVCVSTRGPSRRLIFVTIQETFITRRAAVVEANGSSITVNEIQSCEVRVGERLATSGPQRAGLKDELLFLFKGGYTIRLSAASLADPVERGDEAGAENYMSIAQLSTSCPTPPSNSLLNMPPATQSEAVDLIKRAMRVFEEIPGTAKSYDVIVHTVKSLIDVDRVLLLLRRGDQWQATANSSDSAFAFPEAVAMVERTQNEFATSFSRSLVSRVMSSKETIVVEPRASQQNLAASMQHVQRAVASPIFDERREVMGILYADRSVGIATGSPITLLQASLLDLIANAVSTGLMRQRDAEFRTKTGQFFSKSVLDRLASQKDLLDGKDAEVSILFCDIRGFSRISHRVGPAETIRWINDVLTCLSECVLENEGVVVDYVGDALMAMFGAPEPQADHADRACRAAISMLKWVPELNARYAELAEGKFAIGVGINSGIARVGNTGSRTKFKYGPLGNTVNMASRIEGVTKQFGVPCLITGGTHALLKASPLTRRLSAIQVVGIPEPVQVFELFAENSTLNQQLCSRYDQALTAFEHHQIPEALAILADITRQWPVDLPSQLLVKRSAASFSQTDTFNPVWQLEQK